MADGDVQTCPAGSRPDGASGYEGPDQFYGQLHGAPQTTDYPASVQHMFVLCSWQAWKCAVDSILCAGGVESLTPSPVQRGRPPHDAPHDHPHDHCRYRDHRRRRRRRRPGVAARWPDPGHEVMVLEQHELIGSETSSRNSEVIHAGIYYPPGSLRAKLCVRGKELLYRLLRRERRAARALRQAAGGHAREPAAQARRHQGDGRAGTASPTWSRIGGNAARALEPEVACVAALLSPSTGIIDSHGYMLALEGHIEANGGSVVLRCPVERIERDGGGPVPPDDRRRRARAPSPARSLVISAGPARLQAGAHARLRRQLSAARDLLRQGPVLRALGPLAVQAPHLSDARRRLARPARHGRHRRALQVRARHRVDPRASTTASSRRSSSKFLDFIRSYYPGLDGERLHPDYTGIRPKLYREGEPVPDFAIHGPATHGLEGLVALYGIESPGLTASLAIGEVVAGMLRGKGRRDSAARCLSLRRGRMDSPSCGQEPGPQDGSGWLKQGFRRPANAYAWSSRHRYFLGALLLNACSLHGEF